MTTNLISNQIGAGCQGLVFLARNSRPIAGRQTVPMIHMVPMEASTAACLSRIASSARKTCLVDPASGAVSRETDNKIRRSEKCSEHYNPLEAGGGETSWIPRRKRA